MCVIVIYVLIGCQPQQDGQRAGARHKEALITEVFFYVCLKSRNGPPVPGVAFLQIVVSFL